MKKESYLEEELTASFLPRLVITLHVATVQALNDLLPEDLQLQTLIPKCTGGALKRPLLACGSALSGRALLCMAFEP